MKSTKRFLALFLALALMAFAAGASAAVIRSNGLAPIIEAADGGGGIREQVASPERYETTLANASGTIQLTASADVFLPEADRAPLVRVEKTPFTQTQADTLIDHLVEGELINAESYVPSKDSLQARIERLQGLLDSGDAAPESEIHRDRQVLESQIDELTREMDAAGKTPVMEPVDGKLAPFTREYMYAKDGGVIMESGERIDARAISDTRGYQTFSMYNSDRDTNRVVYTSEQTDFAQGIGYYVPITEDTDLSGTNTLRLDEAGARQAAQALIDALGIDYLTCVVAEKSIGGDVNAEYYGSENTPRQVWVLRYTREVAGVSTTYTEFDCIKVETDDQAAPIPYEAMTFAIDDSGIVDFTWTTPSTVTETLIEDTALISFEDLSAVFETMVFPVNEWMAESGKADIAVSEIRLGMTRVTERDVRDRGLLVPVWDFFGDVTLHYTMNGQEGSMTLENWNLLTVNAIAGTVIDRSLGY